MSEFYQDGIITNFHNLTRRNPDELEYELQVFSGQNSMGLILPSLFSELAGPALTHIIDQLARVNYLTEIVIGLDRADREQFEYARAFFSRLPQRHRILWNDGPRLTALSQELAAKSLAPEEPGKGRNVWFCIGYALASRRTSCIGLHDCDIVTYSREMLACLLYPIANPHFHYDFCKGYYARVANRKLNGRVGRLLVNCVNSLIHFVIRCAYLSVSCSNINEINVFAAGLSASRRDVANHTSVVASGSLSGTYFTPPTEIRKNDAGRIETPSPAETSPTMVIASPTSCVM